jgi:hypothetical protein
VVYIELLGNGTTEMLIRRRRYEAAVISTDDYCLPMDDTKADGELRINRPRFGGHLIQRTKNQK